MRFFGLDSADKTGATQLHRLSKKVAEQGGTNSCSRVAQRADVSGLTFGIHCHEHSKETNKNKDILHPFPAVIIWYFQWLRNELSSQDFCHSSKTIPLNIYSSIDMF